MCGISAIVYAAPVEPAVVAREIALMHAPIAHRGPDGEGFLYIDEGLRAAQCPDEVAGGVLAALSFRWLHVQDRSPAAAQPMASHEGDAWIVFNGEVYNDVELRAELRALGHEFRSSSDTEVVLAAWREWGTECFARFVGMWALVIADLRRGVLLGCRDRFGIRPMFFTSDNGRTAVASEIKQLLPLMSRRQVDDGAMFDFLRHGMVNNYSDRTFFAGVRVAPPASWFELPLRGGAMRTQRYWAMRQQQFRGSANEAAAETERLLKDSIALTLRTPAVAGTFLSGGIDSSLITALVPEVSGRNLDSYSIVFDRGAYAAFDESNYVDDFIRLRGTRNRRASFDAAWMRSAMPEVTRVQEEPLVASAQVAQFRVCELAASAGARVVLDGQGADEVFAGYPHHEWSAWRDLARSGRLHEFVRDGSILMSKYRLSPHRLLMLHVARPAVAPFLRRWPLLRIRYPFIDRRFFRSSDGFVREQALERREGATSAERSAIDRLLAADVRGYGLRPVLMHGDRAGMAHSIETRLPYLDHRLVEFVASVPSEVRVGGGERKRLLRAVAANRLPQSILARRDKMGFLTPEPLWLRRELLEEVKALAANQRLMTLPHLDAAGAIDFVRRFARGEHHDSRAIWRLWSLSIWLDVFDVEGSVS